METIQEKFAPFARRMAEENLPQSFIDSFAAQYRKLVQGQTGLIAEQEIEPVASLPDAEALPVEMAQRGELALQKTAVIKLNGGLGTSMGLQKAKSLLPVKNGNSFLDVIAKQAILANVPLLLMNSFSTDADSLAALAAHPDLDQAGIPFSFLQNKAPKVTRADFSPAIYPENRALEWNPPGHGDIYIALVTSGTLDALLEAGFEYAFVSNSDNLGAVIDYAILGYFAEGGYPFMMEVADRTEMDKKGGHLALQNGRFILRESAQTPKEDMDSFQDIGRHKYFNTNNLWLNLVALKERLSVEQEPFILPLIRNAKTVNPRDAESTAVYQIETAMGSAIGVFEGAQAIRVPRSRFAPVKKTNDLLSVRSDDYILDEQQRIVQNPATGEKTAVVTLDSAHYKFINQLDEHFPHGAPSLLNATRLTVEGEFFFGRDVVVEGEAHLVNKTGQPAHIADGTVLNGRFVA